MSDSKPNSYDDLPYLSRPFYYMHPDRIASVALLAGLDPAPVDQCRVLEIGCAAGGNLVPMAEAHPRSTFVGIDLSPRQVEEGKAIIASLGMTNVSLATLDIVDLTPAFGQFDYIICHGVYSWVPPLVQAKILDVCRENLSPRGLACISYNTYPGWHQRGMVRDMMLYDVDTSASPIEQVRQARELLNLLNGAVKTADVPVTSHELCLREELLNLHDTGDHYIFHEHLESHNEPIYFHQFAARIAAAGLQYVGGAVPDVRTARVAAVVDRMPLRIAGDPLRREQYLDFVAGRTFRQSVVCRAGSAVDYRGNPAGFDQLSIVGLLNPLPTPPDLTSAEPITFVAKNETEMTVGDPVVKAALAILAERMPRSIEYEELCRQVQLQARGSTEPLPPKDRTRLGRSMLQCEKAFVIEVHAHLPACLTSPSERPVMSPFARQQAAAGAAAVTNRRHRGVEFEKQDLLLMPLLDGTRDRAALIRDVSPLLKFAAAAGKLTDAPAPTDDAIPGIVEESLKRIARSWLLIG